ncbi:MAG TPA: MFS transporter, partial [Polyangia bacterium]
MDFAVVFVFLVSLQTFFRHQYFDGRYLPALALSAYAAGKLVLQAPAGRLTDRFGVAGAATLALVAMLLSQVALILAGGAPEVVLPCAFAYGAASAALWPAIYAGVTASFVAEKRAPITSALTVATGAGMAAALALGVALPASFPFAAAVAVACAAVALSLPLFAGSEGDALLPPATDDKREARGSIDRRVLGAGVVMLAQSAAIAGLVSVFREFGRDVLAISFRTEVLGVAAPGAALVLGIVLAGIAGHRFGRGALLPPAFLLAGAALLAVGGASDGLSALVPATFAGLGLGVAMPSTTAFVMDVSDGAKAGAVFGAVLTFEGL